jgi:hypothetical protein
MRRQSLIAAVLVPTAALALASCGSDNPSGLDESIAGGASVGSQLGSPSATRASSCNGTLGAITVELVSVPSGATCVLEGTRVQGDVKVARNGSVSATGARIGGNVQAEDARAVTLRGSTTVIGNVQVKRLAAVRVENSTIDGDLQLEEAGASLVASGNRIGGNLQVTKAASASISSTFVNGDLQLEENSGALSSNGADVRGNFQVFKNRGGVQLVNNRVAQVLECKENVPAPTGSGNVAGEKKEQCRAL